MRNPYSAPEAESEGEGESGVEADGLIYDSRDFETEEENDDWFDAFVAKSLSSDSVGEVAKPAESERPVARPLLDRASDKPKDKEVPKEVHLIEDSPVKIEDLDLGDSADPLAVSTSEPSKEAQAEAIRKQLEELDKQLEQVSAPMP